MRKTATAIVRNSEGQILGVSRKDNHESFSLIGGKAEDYDADIVATLLREAKEETGLDLTDIVLVNVAQYNGFLEHTFTATAVGEINYDEPHVVKYVSPQVILDGAFGDYNKTVFDILGIS